MFPDVSLMSDTNTYHSPGAAPRG
ncbi:MAG: hypothetical protein JWQ75_195, partial [Pseudarthrobacter sp.]|nr:hypothetical protein [Pseudarthrobacter sp.]